MDWLIQSNREAFLRDTLDSAAMLRMPTNDLSHDFIGLAVIC